MGTRPQNFPTSPEYVLPLRMSPKSLRRLPAFVPVPLRTRTDGWTAQRQAEFLAHLALTGLVGKAAKAVGMTRETAYRLRGREGAESFAAAWDTILLRLCGMGAMHARKVTLYELKARALHGTLRPLTYDGAFTDIAQEHDTKALLRLSRRQFSARRRSAATKKKAKA